MQMQIDTGDAVQPTTVCHEDQGRPGISMVRYTVMRPIVSPPRIRRFCFYRTGVGYVSWDAGHLYVPLSRSDRPLCPPLSEDQGATWSTPVCLRDDTLRAGPTGVIDGDYPVAVQMADNRISTSYYWQHDDLDMPWDGGRKYIAGTFFRVG